MREYYIKTNNGNYLVDATSTLVITRSKRDKFVTPFRTRKQAIIYIVRISKKPYMKKHLPLSIYYRNSK